MSNTQNNLNQPLALKENTYFSVSIVVTQKNSKPAIELRALTTDPASIKGLVSCAYHDIPVIVMPKFYDLTKSLASLVEKGILYKEGNEFFFI